MGWKIGLIKNEVEISEACATELQEWLNRTLGYDGGEADPVVYEGKINFNEDHGEGMDFLFDKAAQQILRKHDARGDICFGSLEGDNAGQFWGYRFNGKAAVIKLIGHVSFTPSKKD